jgi:DNA polymerase-3 subunit gamma/tau
VTRGNTPHPLTEVLVTPPQAQSTGDVLAAPPALEPGPTPGALAGSAPEPLAGAAGMFALGDLAPDNWCHLLELLGLGGIVYNIASHCELRSRQDDRLEFILDAGNASLFNDSHSAKLRLALENYFGQPLSVSLIQEVVQRETPAMRTARLANERQEEAVVAIEGDPQLQALITRFDGELDRSSIVPTDA